MIMLSFESTQQQYDKLESIRQSTGRTRSQLLREGLELIVSYYEQNLNTVTDKKTKQLVLEELIKNLQGDN